MRIRIAWEKEAYVQTLCVMYNITRYRFDSIVYHITYTLYVNRVSYINDIFSIIVRKKKKLKYSSQIFARIYTTNSTLIKLHRLAKRIAYISVVPWLEEEDSLDRHTLESRVAGKILISPGNNRSFSRENSIHRAFVSFHSSRNLIPEGPPPKTSFHRNLSLASYNFEGKKSEGEGDSKKENRDPTS